MATRLAYGVALAKLGKANPRVIAMDGDTKNSTFADKFKVRHNQTAISELRLHRLRKHLMRPKRLFQRLRVLETLSTFPESMYCNVRRAGICVQRFLFSYFFMISYFLVISI